MSAVLRRQSDGESLTLEAVRTSSVTRSWVVTDSPVEDGGTISDHSDPTPETAQVDAVVSWIPGVGATDNLRGPARVQAALDWLDASAGTLLDLIGGDRLSLRNVMLTSYSATAAIDGGVDLSVSVKRVRLVVASRVTIRPQPGRGLGASKNKGTAGTEPAKPATRNRSLLKAGMSGITGR